MIDVTGIDLHKFVQDAYDLSDHHEAFVKAGLLHQGALPADFVNQLIGMHNGFHVDESGAKRDHRHQTVALDLQIVQGKKVFIKIHRVIDPNHPDDRSKDRLLLDKDWQHHEKHAVAELLRRHGRMAP